MKSSDAQVIEPEGVQDPDWCWVGSPSASIRLGGHSHMLAFRYAMNLLDENARSQAAVLDLADSYQPPDDSYWSRLANAGTTAAIVWGGNQHNVSFLLSGKPITIVGRRATMPPPAVPGSVVPYRMVIELWQPSLTGLADFVGDHPAPGSVVVVGTPPPKPEEQVREGISVEPFFVDMLAKEGFTPETAPVIDAGTRVAAWEALQDATADIAARAGARFLAVPDAARTSEGTLLPEYCGNDATHANPEYGVLMWHHLIAFNQGG